MEILSKFIISVLNLTVSVTKSAELLENVQRKLTCIEIANVTSIPVNLSFVKELIHIYEMEIDSYKDSLPTKEIIPLDSIPLIAAQLLKRKCTIPAGA